MSEPSNQEQRCRRCGITKLFDKFENLSTGKRSLACNRCLTVERKGRKKRTRGEFVAEWYWNGHWFTGKCRGQQLSPEIEFCDTSDSD